ncbi:Auxin-responsive protein SAUR77 [Cardamine amara subsp. amara]|uniref:Auxin-responsive protein SAUR77 n=1 Tax=Cardamine amara subsp. amara TaxID=228776 RepID=A0ABD1C3V1_CARAN
MAKFGKLTKLKSAIKKWPSLTKNHHSTTVSTASTTASEVSKCEDLQVVYVGKSRRRYMLSSHVIAHPLFQELLDRSSRFIEERDHDHQETVLVACEVVLFEHLLWMLENSCSDHGDNDDRERGSVEELAEFYTY